MTHDKFHERRRLEKKRSPTNRDLCCECILATWFLCSESSRTHFTQLIRHDRDETKNANQIIVHIVKEKLNECTGS